MASLPSQPQRQPSHHQRSPSPTARRPSRSSQSLTSEDSQTLLVGTPTSSSSPKAESPKPHSPSSTDKATAGSSTGPCAPDIKKCWICFSDETEDNPFDAEWVSPCPCALVAHQTCLLDWVADLKAPNRKNAKKVQCPQCKADIRVAQPRSLAVELVQYFDRVNSRAFWPVAATQAVLCVVGGSFIHGLWSIYLLMGKVEADRLLYAGGRNGEPRMLTMAAVALIPGTLALARTTAGDGIFPVLPMLFLFRRQKPIVSRELWPPSMMMTLCALPYIRSIYNGLYKQLAVPYEKAWLKQIQPRGYDTGNATPNNERAQAAANEVDNPNNNEEGMVDFELGVQVEVIEEEEVEAQPQPQPDNAPAAAQPAAQNVGNQPQQPQQPLQPAQPPALQQNVLLTVSVITNAIVGALLFPVVATASGSVIYHVLPSRLVTLPRGRWGQPSKQTGLLQSQWGRSLVGGLMFVVLKDALGLYAKYSLKESHKRRKVLNYGEKETAVQGESWYTRFLGFRR